MTRRHVIIHYHIFKNAGTSVDHALEQAFGDRWATFEGAHAIDVQPAARLRAFLEQHEHLLAVSSHLARPPVPWTECRPIVFLRHPLDRARSVYEFVAADVTQPFHEVAREQGFRGYVEWALNDGAGGVVIRDYQTIHLSSASFRGENILRVCATDADLAEAKSRLGEFPALGLVDQYDRSLQLFERVYAPAFPGLRLPSSRLNATRPSARSLAEKVAALHDELGADLLRRFTASNEHDFALYRFAQRRFTTLCEAAGIGG